MKISIFLICTLCILSPLVFAQSGTKQLITAASLLEEMIDLDRLSEFPSPAFRTIQFSSYDRRSTLPGGPFWFANSDGFGKEPIPNFTQVLEKPDKNGTGRYLIADVKGPGAIVRLWTARISGIITMYIDGADTPIYHGKAEDFFRHLYEYFPESGKLDKKRFGTIYQRDAAYTPIPFGKHLRVEWTGNINEIHFYQLQVRIYVSGTKVVSFTPSDISRYREVIDRVSLILSDPDSHLCTKSNEPAKSFHSILKAKESKEILAVGGSRAMERLSVQLKAENLAKALRQTILQIKFDGDPWGQVQCPVGDFFGAAPGINPYQSLPYTVKADGTMICRFVMPFDKSMKMEIQNYGDQPVEISGTALFRPYKWNRRSFHFRARWRINHQLIASNKNIIDLPFLISSGKGLYVGTASYLLNPGDVPTSWGNWWGEGDEKVFVDNETFPSIFGTGSEDYFNYSWSSPDIFYFPYCGQPRNDGPGNRGFVTNFRWHILDAIPFRRGIAFYMELYHHERTPGLSYGRISYCYLQPGATDDHVPIMPEDVRHLHLPQTWIPAAKKGSRDAVFYDAEDIVAEADNTTMEPGRLWAGSKILVWLPKKRKDRITLRLTTRKSGKKRIHLTLALTPHSGEIRVYLDGKPIEMGKNQKSIKLYRPYRTLLRNFALPVQTWQAGEHTLTLEYLRAREKIRQPRIGIDFIWLQSADK